MQLASKELVNLENKFWQSMVDGDTDTAIAMLCEPAVMVSSHGAMQFDHQQYREMAEQGGVEIKSFELSDMNVMFPTEETAVLTYKVRQAVAQRGQADEVEQEMADSSVWTRKDGNWRCVMHTETALDAGKK
ncbi:MAG: nuclear transport factor 2 family protein [Pseudomonadota bacterium]